VSKYMMTGGYSPESWQAMFDNPGQRQEAVGELVREAGGQLEAFYWTFGADDYVFIADLPDDASATALSVAMASSGKVHDQRTMKLITRDEAVELLAKAKELAGKYRPPGA